MSEHLCGFIEGGDPATWFPDMWRYLVETAGVRSVLDLGCGEGHSLKFFEELGCWVVGVDGVAQEHRMIFKNDFTVNAWRPTRPVDLVWCCEFVEHVEERYAHNFVPALQRGGLVLMTHAFPGQPGFHHVNCRDAEYWKGFMTAAGFEYDYPLSLVTRELAKKNTDPHNHYLRSGMAFRRGG